MKTIPCWQVNAFTNRPFHGNPAAVCWLEEDASEAWMQAVAAEMNLSETAFVVHRTDGYGLRWFTPTVEVPLCGHATLASAHVLFSTGIHSEASPIRFYTLSGELLCHREGERIRMDFPAIPVQEGEPPVGLLEALGVASARVFRSIHDHLVVLESATELRSLTPDYHRLKQVPTRGVIVTSRADEPGLDFISRFFGPGVGIDEDPVTGSAHCCLAPYWANVLGKTSFSAYQASARGGYLELRVEGARIHILGQAVMVWRGEFLHPSLK